MLLAVFNSYLKYVQQYLEESQNGNCYTKITNKRHLKMANVKHTPSVFFRSKSPGKDSHVPETTI